MHSTISRSSSGWEWEGIGNCQLGKYGNGIKVSDGNGNGMGMGIKSMKWEGIGTKNHFPHISNTKGRFSGILSFHQYADSQTSISLNDT